MNHPSPLAPGAARRPGVPRSGHLRRGVTVVASLSLALTGAIVVPMMATAAPVPGAMDDADLLNAPGNWVTVDVLANDEGDFDPTSVVFVNGSERGARLDVPGQGVWTANADGSVTFLPQQDVSTDPTPVTYEVTDADGDTSSATITVTYGTQRPNAYVTSQTSGLPVVIPVLNNDPASWDFSTLRFVDVTTDQRTTEVIVPGEGTWTLDDAAGTVTFTPEQGMYDYPTPIAYEVLDNDGDSWRSELVIEFLPSPVNDVSLDNVPGTAVTVDVLANDLGVLDPTAVRILVPGTEATYVTSFDVPGEGTWTVEPGSVTFTPLATFTGNPTWILYSLISADGAFTNDAVVEIMYRAAAPVVTSPPAVPAPFRAAPLPVTG